VRHDAKEEDMSRSKLLSTILVFAALVPRAANAEAPALLPVQGYLTDASDVPIDGAVTLHLALYDSATAGTALYSETQNTTAANGAFSIYLGETAALDLAIMRDRSELWLGIAINDDAELEPRIRLATAPFAAFAQYCGDASTLEGRAAADFAPAVHSTAWADITGVPADLADGDDNTTYTAGAGLTLTGTRFALNQTTVENYAIGAMGAIANTNPLNHNRYTDAEAVAAVAAADSYVQNTSDTMTGNLTVQGHVRIGNAAGGARILQLGANANCPANTIVLARNWTAETCNGSGACASSCTTGGGWSIGPTAFTCNYTFGDLACFTGTCQSATWAETVCIGD
jgi:hypothetical protein